MLQNYNRYKVLKIFLDSPTESFRLREISRMTKISPVSVKNYLGEFEKEDLIEKYEKNKIPFYRALRDNTKFVRYKKISIIYELYESGLIDYLWDNLNPEAIILYGSHVRGESIEGSDIDLFIIGKYKDINLELYEDKLGKRIHLMYDQNAEKIPSELKNNLINGIILKGYLKVFK